MLYLETHAETVRGFPFSAATSQRKASHTHDTRGSPRTNDGINCETAIVVRWEESMASNNAPTRNIRVLSASTGACYNVALHPSELT
jgi:hypothetical protein